MTTKFLNRFSPYLGGYVWDSLTVKIMATVSIFFSFLANSLTVYIFTNVQRQLKEEEIKTIFLVFKSVKLLFLLSFCNSQNSVSNVV